jgi:hypothetical protein
MNDITLHGKPAVKVNAKKVIWANTEKSKLYDIDGDEAWIPNSLCKFTADENWDKSGDIPGTLIIVEWKYNQIFPNG